ncbi:MAG: hypothetical protein Q9214_003013 [Letrouitia sp. 1 TL-2023]
MFQCLEGVVGISPSTTTVSDSFLVVVVDAQNEYDHGKLAIVDVENSSKVIGDVFERYQPGAGDIVYVLHDTPEGAPLFTLGIELSEEMEGLKARNGEKARVCISSTARIGAEPGYHVSLIRDGFGDRDIPGVKAS